MAYDDIPTEYDFTFADGFADAIARVVCNWASLDYTINRAIWALSGIADSPGACVTTQIYTTAGRLSAVLALLKLRNADKRLIARVNKFAERMREPQEIRNRIIHDIWVKNERDPTQMGRWEISAPKTLKFAIVDTDLASLRADLKKVSECRAAFHDLLHDILEALPSLPKAPDAKLQPVRSDLRPRRSRAT